MNTKHKATDYPIAASERAASQRVHDLIKNQEVTLDLNGHSVGRETDISSDLARQFRDSKRLAKIVCTSVKTNKQVQFNDLLTLSTCYTCGEYLSNWTFDGKVFKAAKACVIGKCLTYKFQINIPSGKFIVANDLRGLVALCGGFYVNTILGCRQTSEAYAVSDLAHAVVGNTCPTVWRKNKETFFIGVSNGRKNPRKGLTRVAGVCTDLWWYSIMDYDIAHQRLAGRSLSAVDTVHCTPGVYEFTHVYHTVNRDSNKSQIFTSFKRIAAPKPIAADPYRSLTYTADQIILSRLSDSFYSRRGDKPDAALYRAIDQLMLTIGAGAEYHPNGWWNSKPTLDPIYANNTTYKIPTLSRMARWYDISNFSIIYKIAHKTVPVVHPSFVQLTYNILQCITTYGSEQSAMDQPGLTAGDKKKINQRFQKTAYDLLTVLKKNYPTI